MHPLILCPQLCNPFAALAERRHCPSCAFFPFFSLTLSLSLYSFSLSDIILSISAIIPSPLISYTHTKTYTLSSSLSPISHPHFSTSVFFSRSRLPETAKPTTLHHPQLTVMSGSTSCSMRKSELSLEIPIISKSRSEAAAGSISSATAVDMARAAALRRRRDVVAVALAPRAVPRRRLICAVCACLHRQ